MLTNRIDFSEKSGALSSKQAIKRGFLKWKKGTRRKPFQGVAQLVIPKVGAQQYTCFSTVGKIRKNDHWKGS